MSTQPEAIRLADALDRWHEGVFPVEAAAELRRLHAVNQELLALAHQYASDLRYPPIADSMVRRLEAALAVIKKAEGA